MSVTWVSEDNPAMSEFSSYVAADFQRIRVVGVHFSGFVLLGMPSYLTNPID